MGDESSPGGGGGGGGGGPPSKEKELVERLQQENNMLKEIIKRKDATIADSLAIFSGGVMWCNFLEGFLGL